MTTPEAQRRAKRRRQNEQRQHLAQRAREQYQKELRESGMPPDVFALHKVFNR